MKRSLVLGLCAGVLLSAAGQSVVAQDTVALRYATSAPP